MSSRAPQITVGLSDTEVRAKLDEIIGQFKVLKRAAGEALDADATARAERAELSLTKQLNARYRVTEQLAREQKKLAENQSGGASSGGFMSRIFGGRGGGSGGGGMGSLLGGAEGGLGMMGGVGLGAAGGIAAFAAAIPLAKSAMGAAEQEQVSLTRLQVALRNSGLSWKANQQAIEDNMAAMRRLGVTNDQTLDATTRAVNATHNLADAQHINAIALDLSRARGMDFLQAQQLLIRAYEGQTTGLKRIGVEVAKGVTGTQALMQVEKTYHGQAQAYAQTTAGRVAMLRAEWNNLNETLGKKFAQVWGVVVKYLAEFVVWVQTNMPAIQKQFRGTFEAVAQAVQAFVALFRSIWRRWGSEITFVTKFTLGVVLGEIKTVFKLISDVLKIFTDIIRGNWSKLWADIKRYVADAVSAIPQIIGSGLNAAGVSAENLGISIVNGISRGLANMANVIMQTLVAPVNAVINQINGITSHIPFFGGGLHIGTITPPSISAPTIGGGGGGGGGLATITSGGGAIGSGAGSTGGGGFSTGGGSAGTSGTGGFQTPGGGGGSPSTGGGKGHVSHHKVVHPTQKVRTKSAGATSTKAPLLDLRAAESLARAQVGLPYIWGGGHGSGGPGRGWDCSGLATWLAANIRTVTGHRPYTGGIMTSQAAYQVAHHVPHDNYPVVWGFTNFGEGGIPGPGHMGIRIGSTWYVAPHTGAKVYESSHDDFGSFGIPPGLWPYVKPGAGKGARSGPAPSSSAHHAKPPKKTTPAPHVTTTAAGDALSMSDQAAVAFADSAESFIRAALGPGDLGTGTGGSSAWGAAGGQVINVNLRSLVPTSDPKTLAAIAAAVGAAFTQSPYVPSTVTPSGA